MSFSGAVPEKPVLLKTQTRYIDDQGWSLLTAFRDPLPHLAARHVPEAGPATKQADPWVPLSREDVICGEWAGPTGALPVRRLVITSEAGGGKSVALQWLWQQWNRSGSGRLAILMNAGDFHREPLRGASEATVHARLTEFLADQLIKPSLGKADSAGVHPQLIQTAQRMIERARRLGKLVLLIDGLDQASSESTLLKQVVESQFWAECSFVLAGRQYAVGTRPKLFADGLAREPDDPRAWKFVRMEPLNADQITLYLDLGREGRPQYADIPPNIQPMLGTPRVLWYLRELAPDEYSTLSSGADLFERVLGKIIWHGLEQSREARLIGHTGTEEEIPEAPQASSQAEAWELLQTIAYAMLFHSEYELDEQTGQQGPPTFNFDQVSKAKFSDFAENEVVKRFHTKSKGGMNWAWRAMAALGNPLEQGVFESDGQQGQGLNQVLFRNRQLLEFLAARYLAQHGTTEDAQRLHTWLYRPDRPETNALYWVWQYLCEMPESVIARNPPSWLMVIEPLYRRATADPQSACGWTASRSTEMIFRSWTRLDKLGQQDDPVGKRARYIREWWQGEFASIAKGDQTPERQQAALDFEADFLLIPAGTVNLGSRAGGRTMPTQWRSFFENGLSVARHEDHASVFENWIRENPEWGGYGPKRAAILDQWRYWWLEALNREASDGSGMDWLSSVFTVHNEQQQIGVTVTVFELGRSPVLNLWYRLFAPDHGLAPTPWAADYERYSGSDGQPAIFLSFYDCWAYCQWARCSDGRSCRLPWEHEWEYVAKYGVQNPDWPYWWGPEFDHSKATAHRGSGQTTPPQTTEPSSAHASSYTRQVDINRQIGIMDQLGNVWEWCQDQYEPIARREARDAPGDADRSRVLRGGAFCFEPNDCRLTVRNYRYAGYLQSYCGFRAARAGSPR
jgi:formylglycine-generating enzyme required for sulfatase activity